MRFSSMKSPLGAARLALAIFAMTAMMLLCSAMQSPQAQAAVADEACVTVSTAPCAFGSTATFSANSAVTAASYQWQYRKTDGGKWISSSAESATTDTLSYRLCNSNKSYEFRCLFSCTDGTVIVSDPCGFDILSVSVSGGEACMGCQATFSASLNFEAIDYQWQYRKTSNGKWINSSLACASTATFVYKLTSSNKDYEFRCLASSAQGAVACSDALGFLIPCAEHDWGQWSSNGDATCTADGTKTRVCAVCGKSETETDEGSAGHVFAQSVTCTRCGADPEVGESITLGYYEQDNDASDGAEPIEWTVLDVTDDTALLISRHALDSLPFNESGGESSWDCCTLRTWLNTSFLKSAFTYSQRCMINKTEDDRFGVFDKIFCLSVEEARAYFESDSDRLCYPTPYAAAQHNQSCKRPIFSEDEPCGWWLRTLPEHHDYATAVDSEGFCDTWGFDTDSNDFAVRPALRISL